MNGMVNDASVEKTDSDPESMGLDQQVSDSTPFCRPLQNEELKNSMMMDFFFSKKKVFSDLLSLLFCCTAHMRSRTELPELD